ncbi:MAG: DUF4340 domain-containing protein [Gammaproteobacteria bacterium]
MNWKTFLLLIVVAAAAIWGVIQIRQKPGVETPPAAAQALYPGLQDKLNDVKALRISKGGNEVVADLKRNEQGWVVANKHDYPANLEAVRKLLIDLGAAKVVETKTANPEFYARLGVEDVAGKEAKGVRLDIDGVDKPLSLVVGDSPPNTGTATYVRRADEKESLLIGASLTPAKEAQSWMQQPVLDVPTARVQRVVIHHPDGESLTVTKDSPGDANFKLFNLQQGRELQYEGAANPIGSVLASLQLEDVVPASEFKPAEQTGGVEAEFYTFDGTKISAKAFSKNDKHYVYLRAAYDEEQAKQFASVDKKDEPAKKDEAAAEADKKDEPAKEPAKPDPKEAAATLDKRLEPWVFVVSSYKYDQLNKRANDLLKPLEQPKPEATPTPAEGAATPPATPNVDTQSAVPPASRVEEAPATPAASPVPEPAAAPAAPPAEPAAPASPAAPQPPAEPQAAQPAVPASPPAAEPATAEPAAQPAAEGEKKQ